MSCLLLYNDEECQNKINIDDLYEKNKQRDLRHLSIFNKILNRIHRRIKYTSRTKTNDKFVWFTVPEYIFGEPLYNNAECIAYIVAKLTDNGFRVQYVHPNTLFITWNNWVPAYVRQELKNKRGWIVDEQGNVQMPAATMSEMEIMNVGTNEVVPKQMDTTAGSGSSNNMSTTTATKQYNSIKSYQPNGTMVYTDEMLERIGRRSRGER
jgi:hypothetical protein